jgi:hypothetical protein
MPQYDISSLLELPITVSQPVLRELLIKELHSMQIEAETLEGETIYFRVPLLHTITRGSRLKGISSCQIGFTTADNRYTVSYKIATVPMRLFCILLPVLAIIYLPIQFAMIQGASVCSLLISIFGILCLSGLAYTAGKAAVSSKFRAFIFSAANEAQVELAKGNSFKQ